MVIAAAFVAMTVAEAVFSPKVASPVEHVLVAGLAMASLAWRRRAPLVVTAIVIASNIAVNPNGEFTTLLSLVLVCFTVGSETRPPRNYLGLGLVVVPFLVVSVDQELRAQRPRGGSGVLRRPVGSGRAAEGPDRQCRRGGRQGRAARARA